MARGYRIPDYKKMYPEAGEEVLAVLRTTERKMQYQEYDLKTEQTVISRKDQTITTIPSREDAMLERAAEKTGTELTPHMLRRYFAVTRWNTRPRAVSSRA